MTERRRRFIVSSVTLAALTVILSACSAPEQSEPTPTFAAASTAAQSTPEVTEPPYETDLNLTTAEKKAADDAYDVLVAFMQANNDVMADSGQWPERALAYTTGEVEDEFVSSFEEMVREGQRGVGSIVHSQHDLVDVDVNESTQEGFAEFDSCVSFEYFDLIDRTGKSMAGEDTGRFLASYTVTLVDRKWKLSRLENWSDQC